MCFILAAVVVNVALDLLFIVVFRWGVEGAAWATVVAQAAGAGIALYHVNRRHPLLSIRRRDLVFDRKLFARGLKIGLPTGVQQCSIALGLIALLGVVNRLGTDALTAYGAAGKIEALITQAVLTLSGALASFCGQNIGARRFDRVRKGVRFVMAVNLLFGLLSFAAVYFRGKEMMQAFTADEAVIAIGHEYLLIIGGFFAVHGALNVLNGALRGAGDTLFGMLTGIVSFWLARIPLAYFLGGLWGGRGIWWAVNISVAIGLVATCIYYQAGKWRTSRNGELPRMEN
jgi:putative MATE family efflux protein